MIDSEQMAIGNRGRASFAGAASARLLYSGSKVVFIASAPAALMPAVRRKQHIGRKGRRVITRWRLIDGAFLTFAMGAAAIIWWSTL